MSEGNVGNNVKKVKCRLVIDIDSKAIFLWTQRVV